MSHPAKKKKSKENCKIAFALLSHPSNNDAVVYRLLGSVWYMCLKTKNCCLKTFVEIRVGKKVR